MTVTDNPIRLEVNYNASIETVWKALTVQKEMVKWYFEAITAFEAKAQFSTTFTISYNTKTFTHQWTVKDVIPLKKISYYWSYKEYEGLALVTFELLKTKAGTKLILTNNTLKDFPIHMEEFTRESCKTGWTILLHQNLNQYLNKV